MTPLSRAEETSHAKFSMNQAGRRKVSEIASSRSSCSRRVLWVSKFGCVVCAPTVERQTTFLGRAAFRAALTAEMTARASGNPGAGSNSDGGSMKTPSTCLKASARAAASSISARATSQPFPAHDRPFSASRTTARTDWSAARIVRASAPPTLPVIPVIAYIGMFLGHLYREKLLSQK